MNSIEEDIRNAEHFIKSIKTDKEYKEENGWHGYYNKEIVELARMLEHILSDYKRVLKINEVLLKENETYKKQYFCLINRIENKIDKFDYEFEKAKMKNDNDRANYYWDLTRNFKKLLESEE